MVQDHRKAITNRKVLWYFIAAALEAKTESERQCLNVKEPDIMHDVHLRVLLATEMVAEMKVRGVNL